jgi:hypothetical protein
MIPIITYAVRVGGIVPVVRKAISSRIESIQTAAGCSNPDQSRTVFIDCPYRIVAETVRFGRVILIMGKRFCLPVKFVKPTATGADPEDP